MKKDEWTDPGWQRGEELQRGYIKGVHTSFTWEELLTNPIHSWCNPDATADSSGTNATRVVTCSGSTGGRGTPTRISQQETRKPLIFPNQESIVVQGLNPDATADTTGTNATRVVTCPRVDGRFPGGRGTPTDRCLVPLDRALLN